MGSVNFYKKKRFSISRCFRIRKVQLGGISHKFPNAEVAFQTFLCLILEIAFYLQPEKEA